MSDPYRVTTCVHGFPVESCPLCLADPMVTTVEEVWFELADEWVPELCLSPEYQLNLHVPPAFWLKRDRDRFYDHLPLLREKGAVLW